MKFRLIPSFFLLFLLLTAGCSGLEVLEPKTDNTRFHILRDGLDADEAGVLDPAGPVIQVGPASLAKHLQQSRIATYGEDGTGIAYAARDLWAEPLEGMVTRLLANRLAFALSSARVGPQRLMEGMDWDSRVGFQVERLGGSHGGTVQLQVRWWVEGRDERQREIRMTFLEEPVAESSGDYSPYVRALGRLLEEWSREVATVLGETLQGHPPEDPPPGN